MSDDYTYLPPADPAEAALDMEYTYDAPLIELVRPGELSALRSERDALGIEVTRLLAQQEKANGAIDAMRADLDLLAGWLDAVTNGLSVKELAQLPDVCAEVRARWGMEE